MNAISKNNFVSLCCQSHLIKPQIILDTDFSIGQVYVQNKNLKDTMEVWSPS